MPAYDYRCTVCDDEREIRHPASAATPPCPRCGGPLQKLFRPAGLVFTGSGFHVTDYPRGR